MDSSSYPKYLVPTEQYPADFQPNEKHILCRWAENIYVSKDGTKTEDTSFPPACFASKLLFDYSVNLIGLSVERDSKIKLVKESEAKFLKKWHSGEQGHHPNESEFEWVNSRDYFYLIIKFLNQLEFKKIAEPIEFKGKSITPETTMYKLSCKHDPTCSNYAHFIIHPIFIIKHNEKQSIEYHSLAQLLEYFNVDPNNEKDVEKIQKKLVKIFRVDYVEISSRIERLNRNEYISELDDFLKKIHNATS